MTHRTTHITLAQCKAKTNTLFSMGAAIVGLTLAQRNGSFSIDSHTSGQQDLKKYIYINSFLWQLFII